ncbi:hypothetical protein XELAEV_18002009mg [Xenopus laevis]|nr:hypothetical protein XELAEV_18002009mg [Xenopus laevis]
MAFPWRFLETLVYNCTASVYQTPLSTACIWQSFLQSSLAAHWETRVCLLRLSPGVSPEATEAKAAK